MRSHGLKIILAGRILEILYQRTTGFGCRPGGKVYAHEIADRLNEMIKKKEFSPRVCGYLKQASGVSVEQVTWLLRTMRSMDTPLPYGLVKLPLVRHHPSSKGNHASGPWSLAATTAGNKMRPNGLGE